MYIAVAWVLSADCHTLTGSLATKYPYMYISRCQVLETYTSRTLKNIAVRFFSLICFKNDKSKTIDSHPPSLPFFYCNNILYKSQWFFWQGTHGAMLNILEYINLSRFMFSIYRTAYIYGVYLNGLRSADQRTKINVMYINQNILKHVFSLFTKLTII